MIKYKKLLILFLLTIMMFTICSCDKILKYEGEEYDLYTVALNSLIGVYGSAFNRSPVLEIKETDEYGRVMFYYEEGSIINAYNILIAQKSDDEFVYYYEDYNFISSCNNEFAKENIETLKANNDWNKPIDETKLIRKKIIEQEDISSLDSNIIEEKFTKIMGAEWEFNATINELTTNEEGKKIVLVTAVCGYREATDKYFALIIDSEGNFDKDEIMEITDHSNYQEQLKQFKEKNNWY